MIGVLRKIFAAPSKKKFNPYAVGILAFFRLKGGVV